MQAPDTPSSPAPRRRRGRPLDDDVRRRVLAAARRLLDEEGLGRLSVERVAELAGVGKPAIYRRWANAQALAMAAFMAGDEEQGEPVAPVDSPAPRHRERAPRAALIEHLTGIAHTFDTARGRQITQMMAAADPDSELAKAFRHQAIQQARQVGAALIERGIREGAWRRPVDLEIALDMIYGPIFYRLLAGHAALSPVFVRRLVDLLLDGLRRREPEGRSGRRT